jgi:hypothetical protein
MAKRKQPQPQWQPVSMLPTFARHIDGMLEADCEQYETLLEAKPKPYVLDNATVARVIRAFETQAKDFWLFEEQLNRWQAGALTTAQRQEVERLLTQMRALRENNEKVLVLARELAQGTIEKQLAKSDAELGLEFLLRQFPKQ